MGGVEAVLTYGIRGWPAWVHHEHREMHWRVLEVIEPDTAKAGPATTSTYILLVVGPYAYLPGDEGEQYITATRRDGRWQIEPNTTAYPRRGTPPGELQSNMGPTSGSPARAAEVGTEPGRAAWDPGLLPRSLARAGLACEVEPGAVRSRLWVACREHPTPDARGKGLWRLVTAPLGAGPLSVLPAMSQFIQDSPD